MCSILLLLAATGFAAPTGAVDLATDFESEISGVTSDVLGNALAYGDLNNDGDLDLVAGATNVDEIRVFFGPLSSGLTASGNADVVVKGNVRDETGWSLAVGDLTDDGIDDLVVSSPSAFNGQGVVSVLEGPFTAGTYDPYSSPNVIHMWWGESAGPLEPANLGWDVAIGDFDGDGLNDLAMGAAGERDIHRSGGDPWGASRPVGAVYVVSQPDMLVAAMAVEHHASTAIYGIGTSGVGVANAGDTNGDGIDDLLIGSPELGAGNDLYSTGAATLFEGRTFWDHTYRLASYPSSSELSLNIHEQVYTLVGDAVQGQQAGYAVAPAGDFNGDGYADFLVGAPGHRWLGTRATPTSTIGKAYLVYGHEDQGGLEGNSVLSNVAGLEFTGTHPEHIGIDVNRSGDIDGDGADDLLVGGLAGAGYLFYGTDDPTFSITYTCLGGGNCTGLFSANVGLAGSKSCSANADASFSGSSTANTAASPFNFAGRTLLGGGDLTGDGSQDILVGAPAQEIFNRPIFGPGHVYVIEGD